MPKALSPCKCEPFEPHGGHASTMPVMAEAGDETIPLFFMYEAPAVSSVKRSLCLSSDGDGGVTDLQEQDNGKK
jgi:hypothetical protein